jgi:hypothetical protein
MLNMAQVASRMDPIRHRQVMDGVYPLRKFFKRQLREFSYQSGLPHTVTGWVAAHSEIFDACIPLHIALQWLYVTFADFVLAKHFLGCFPAPFAFSTAQDYVCILRL